MGLPAKQRTNGSKKRRASHFALKATQTNNCAGCKSPVLPHQACSNCGTYRGKQVIDVKKRQARAARKAKTKA